MYHGIKVQAWDAYIWICLWMMRKGCTCSSCSTHCRYQIKIPKALFNSNRGHIAIQKWSHIFILTSFRQIGTVHWPRRLQPWLDCFWVNLHFSTYCRSQIKILKALFNSNWGHIAIQKWSYIFIWTSFGQISTMRRVERVPGDWGRVMN